MCPASCAVDNLASVTIIVLKMNVTTQTAALDNAAARAHDFAEKFAALRGIPEDMFLEARRAAEIGGLTGRAAECFVHRAVGHWMNMKVGTRGV